MINHLKYAKSKYVYWISLFANLLGIVALIQFDFCVSFIIVVACFLLAFIIPLIASFKKNNFKLDTMGKTKVSLTFGDLFEEECFVVTTNNYFDINPTSEYISPDSLLGIYINDICSINIIDLENSLKSELCRNEYNEIIPAEYGDYIKKKINDKTVYFLVFTDRQKTKQPNDFYIKTVQTFFRNIVDENHGKVIAIPLLGDNNNLSNSGFSSSESAFMNLMTMINCFEIVNQRSELKLKIVALPEKRSELIKAISLFLK